MQGLPRLLSLILNSFNKFSNTGARMLDSLYHMTTRKTLKLHFWRENVSILSFFRQLYNGRH